MLVLAIAATAALWAFKVKDTSTDTANNSQATQQTDQQEQEAEDQLQPEDVTEAIRKALAAKFPVIEGGNPSGSELSITIEKRSPPYKPAGYNFYTDYNGGSTMYISSLSNGHPLPYPSDVAARQEIAKVYTDLGLKKTETIQVEGAYDATDVYMGQGLICTVNTPESQISGSLASCGSIDRYAEGAAAVKPFADILPGVDESTVLLRLQITDSETPGYQKAQLAYGGFGGGGLQALFYRKTDGEWQFFRKTQEPPACSTYDTEDLRKAFKGEECFDEQGNRSTVQ